MVTVPVILAGGIGERFWPASKSTYPKQLLKLTGNQSILEATIDRVAPLCKQGVKPLLITGKNIVPALKKVIPAEKNYDIIVEPVGKNTAPAIGLAAAWIRKNYGEAVMVVVSADHAITPVTDYLKAVSTAVKQAKAENGLVVFGITPDRPDTGYGYIELGKELSSEKKASVFSVKRFVEKPTLLNAKKYLKSGRYLWNSGMFVWKTSFVLNEFERSLPVMYKQILMLEKKMFSKKAIEAFYSVAESISIDYGIMEHASSVSAVAGKFKWDDVGSWEAIRRLHAADTDGNVLVGSLLEQDGCHDTMVFNQTAGSVVTVGLDNVSVIAADGAVLVIHHDRISDLKGILGKIKKGGRFPSRLF